MDVLGSYDPHMKKVILKEEKIKYWISKGAQTSDTVHNLLVKNGVLTGDKRKVKLPAKKVEEVKEEVKKEESPIEEKEVPVEEVKPEAVEVKTEESPIEEKKEEVKETENPKVDVDKEKK